MCNTAARETQILQLLTDNANRPIKTEKDKNKESNIRENL
jgi:hypothetical protein